ncbi:hypothetical protein SESBI_03626 [Sesbania bispinosa]|nr:hypothetical protein SESBI_03626 [Sesbania bispinosa]
MLIFERKSFHREISLNSQFRRKIGFQDQTGNNNGSEEQDDAPRPRSGHRTAKSMTTYHASAMDAGRGGGDG